MADSTDNMVLRTVYLPKDLDQALKSAAVRGARSKGDVIRDLILTGLTEKQKNKQSYFVEATGEGKRVALTSPKSRVVTIAKAKAIANAKVKAAGTSPAARAAVKKTAEA